MAPLLDGTALPLVLLGAVIALDQVSVAQLQLGHPLVAGTLAGALAGNTGEGALVGGLLGLILAGHRPVGGVIPPDGGPAAVVAAASLARVEQRPTGAASGEALAWALGIGLVLAILGQVTEGWTRKRSLHLVRQVEANPTARAVRKAMARACALAAVRGALTVALALPVAIAVVGRASGPGPARAVVLAIAGGVGLSAQQRLLGTRRPLGPALALLGAALGLALSTGVGK
jgi:mannose/fructose/N-acetylgalactosamine-specific phosphotransferase system component IIC